MNRDTEIKTLRTFGNEISNIHLRLTIVRAGMVITHSDQQRVLDSMIYGLENTLHDSSVFDFVTDDEIESEENARKSENLHIEQTHRALRDNQL